MTTGHVAAALMAIFLSGCAAAPPQLHGTWYLQEAGSEREPSLYVAILNRGLENRRISGLILNSPGGSREEGWQKRFDPVTLQPGGMLVRKVGDFSRKAGAGSGADKWPKICQLPISIVVLFDERSEAQITPAGLMPSALPNGWEDCP